MSDPVVRFEAVNIVFGSSPDAALVLMDEGQSREEIKEATGQVLGVHNCTLDVGEGEIVVLMGLSGSGKSTLLRAVNGLNPVIRGRALVHDGTDYVNPQTCPPDVLRRLRTDRVAMVFQHFGLLPWRTVAENVGFGLEIAGVPVKERSERVENQLTLVGLEGWGGRKVHELSGGMQQRVGLARAFATDAPILLMDEPFSALDPLIRDRLQDELLDLQAKLRRTIIFVSHDLDEALKLGNRIAIMEGGEIVQIGTPQDIVLNPASDYVREFVAHMNPLNVLRAREIMAVPDDGNGFVMAPAGGLSRDGQTVAGIAIENAGSAPEGAVITVGPETTVRAIIEARLAHADPFIVIDAGEIAGIVRDEDLFRCLVRSGQQAA
jgi:glycine betaine/proline transport system ATP-binding protein